MYYITGNRGLLGVVPTIGLTGERWLKWLLGSKSISLFFVKTLNGCGTNVVVCFTKSMTQTYAITSGWKA